MSRNCPATVDQLLTDSRFGGLVLHDYQKFSSICGISDYTRPLKGHTKAVCHWCLLNFIHHGQEGHCEEKLPVSGNNAVASFEPSLPDVKFKKFQPMDTTGPPFCNYNELVECRESIKT